MVELKRVYYGREEWDTSDEEGVEHTLGFYPSSAGGGGSGGYEYRWLCHGVCHRENGRDWYCMSELYWSLNSRELHGRLLLW